VSATEKASYKTKEQKRLEAEERQGRSRRRKAQQQIVHALEKEILLLETRQKEITAEMEKPQTYEKGGLAMKLNRELSEVSDQLAPLSASWEKEAAKLMEMNE